MMIHHENYHGGSGGDSAGGAFPNVVLLPSDVSGGASGDNGGLGGGFVRTVQPYDMTPTVHTVFKSPGAMLGYPFTHAQWKELERQAMIYKYMMASIPVPPELLSPIFTPRDGPPRYPFGNGYSLRYSSNGDPEPGRCKRTDGKKWRCSREVAPDQKYCERHLHRGRPRSRKPVELNPSVSKKTRLLHQSSPLPKTEDPSLLLHKSSQSSHSLESPAKEARNTDWLMKGESSPVPMLDQWPSLMQSKIGSTAESSLNNFNPFLAKEEEHLNLSFNTGYPSGEIHHFSKNQLGLNSYSLPLDKPQSENPKGFIDAWSDSVSTGNNSRCSVSADENASLSSLTLSVGGNNPIGGSEMGQAHLGFGVLDSNRNPSKNHSHATSWLGSTSWVSSKTPGGPLAEVLGPGINATLSDPPSPHAGNEDTGSVLTTTVSSPSGVLRRTLASFSDSSGGSSPTPSSSMARSEITFKWFNPNNLASSN